MKKYFIIVIILITSVSANAKQKIYLDNDRIQEYKGKLGKWTLIQSKKSMLLYAKKYSTSISNIYKINNLWKKQISNNYYFVPYSDEYLTRISNKKNKRTLIFSAEEKFIWPINGVNRITSVLGFRNGKFHPGLDLPAPRGKPIVAAMEGLVTYSKYAGGYGKIIILKHRNNFTTKYSHNSVNLVKEGDFVKKGQIIGLAGSTGNSTGNHLHFEVRCKDIPLDPFDFLPKKNDLRMMHTLKNWK